MPLRHCLPETPRELVGRDDDLAWVAQCLAHSPLAVIWGPAGLGKTTLALGVLRERLARRPTRCAFVSVRGLLEPLAVDVLRALTPHDRRCAWSELCRQPDLSLAAVLDAAERAPAWVIVDDLDQAPEDEAASLLLAVDAHARRSRWLFTTRTPPPVPGFETRMLPLSPLTAEALQELARSRLVGHPSPEELMTMLKASAGSPWQLQQQLGLRRRSPTTEAALEGLSEVARDLLMRLRDFDVPIPLSLADELARDRGEARQELASRALAEQSEAGIWLHDVTRAVLRTRAVGEGAWLAAVAERLSRSGDVELELEALRLVLTHQGPEAADAWLAVHGDRLLHEGAAGAMGRLLAIHDHSTLVRWKTQVALELGSPVELPPELIDDPSMVLRRTLSLWRHGRFAPALDELRRLETLSAPAAEGTAFEIGELRTRAELHAGDLDAAQRVASSLRPPDHEAAVRLALLGAEISAHRDDRRALRHHLDTAANRLEAQQTPADSELADLLAGWWIEHGWLSEAAHAVDSRLHTRSLASERGRDALVAEARIRIDQGRLPEVEVLLERLSPLSAAPSSVRPMLRYLGCQLALAQGRVEGLDLELGETIAQAASLAASDVLWRARVLRAQLRVETGTRPLDSEGWSTIRSGKSPVSAVQEEAGRLLMRAAGARVSEMDTDAPPPQGEGQDTFACLRSLAALQLLVTTGESHQALGLAATVLEMARRIGYGLVEAEVHRLGCEAATAAHAWDRVADHAQSLAEQAAQMRSLRWQNEASFFQNVIDPRGTEVIQLVELARAMDVAPCAARRAKRLLGGEAVLDAVDRAVLEGLKEAPGWARVQQRRFDGATPEATWGVVRRSRTVWTLEGDVVELQARPVLWRLLELLLQRPDGSASRREMVEASWEVASYEPRRHDNRLRSAVRELRELLEPDPTAPIRMATTDEGYALRGTVYVSP